MSTSVACYLLLLFTTHGGVINVNDFGAIPDVNTVDAAFNNSAAFQRAFNALQASSINDTLLFPSDFIYYMYPISVIGMKDKTIIIDSLIYACDDIESWPHSTNASGEEGYGRIDGQGYKWWSLFLINDIVYHRPHLFEILYGTNITIQDLELSNSPNFHLHLMNEYQLLVENVTVWANTTQQKQLWLDHDLWNYEEDIPMFPFNTDGIDVGGRNIIVRNCSIHNYDDSVCLKPSKIKSDGYCTENVLVENVVQIGGAGMSVGSVPPHPDTNCVQNVIFRNIIFQSPLKAIYVKTNSGNEGDGRIKNITYENIVMYQDEALFPEHAFLWPIYIGPQQQKEPNGGGDGCFVEFIRCPTQPRVNLTDIYLTNVTAVNSIFTNPAVLNCNYTNPCTGFKFNNVKFTNVTYDPWDKLYVCKNVYGEFNECDPKPICFENVTDFDFK